MQVWVVGVGVAPGRVHVPVRVRRRGMRRSIVDVLVMRVVLVQMLVLDRLVQVLVAVMLGQM